MARYTPRIVTSGAHGIHHIPFSSYFRKSLIFLDISGFFMERRELGWERYTPHILTSGARGIHHIPFSYLFAKRCFIMIKCFLFLFGKRA